VTGDAWFDQHHQREVELKTIWKKIPNDAYVSCRQAMRGTPVVYTVQLGRGKRGEEFMSRDIVCDILIEEYGMSYNQASRALLSAALTPGQRIYLQRHTRLVMAATERDEMKRTGHVETLIPTGAQIRVNGQDGIFLRYSGNEGFAVVALPTPGIDGFGDAEVPVLDLEVVDAGGPEVAEDFMFDKEMDEDAMAGESGGLEEALEHIEQAEEIVEDLVLEEGGAVSEEGEVEESDGKLLEEGDDDDSTHEENEEDGGEDDGKEKPPFAARRQAVMPGAPRPGVAPGISEKLTNLQRIIQDPNTDPQTLQQAQTQWTQLKRQVPASRHVASRCKQCGEDIAEGSEHRQDYSREKGYSNCHTVKAAKGDYKCVDCGAKNPQFKSYCTATGDLHTKPAPKGTWSDKKAFFGYRTPDDMEAMERPNHKTKGPKLTDTKLKGDSWVPRNEDKNPLPKEDTNLNKTANAQAQRRVHTHYTHSGDLRRAIEVNRDDLSIEDIRGLCKFYANTGKIAHSEANELAFWFIGDKPRLLCASDMKVGYSGAQCTCEGAYDRYCPDHGAKEQKRAATCTCKGSTASDCPIHKQQKMVKCPKCDDRVMENKMENHKRLCTAKAASMRRRADGTCPKCGTPLNQAGACPTCNSSAEQQEAQDSPMAPTTALSARELPRNAARHKDGCGCGFCSRMRDNQGGKKEKEHSALSSRDMKKVAHDGVGIFTPALHNGSEVLVIAIDNTSLRATVQDGNQNQRQVDLADLEPVKKGPYSGLPR
jgi:hypothetical protein